MIVNIDGKITSGEVSDIPMLNGDFSFGEAVFETLRTYNGKVFKLEEHLERLMKSAEEVKLNSPWTKNQIRKEVEKALSENKFQNVRIRIVFIRQHLVVMLEELAEKPADWYENGVKMVTVTGKRKIPKAKIYKDPFLIQAKQHAVDSGAYESFLAESETEIVREGCYSNVFWVKDGQLFTADKGVLFGITRDTVIRLAKTDNPCRFRDIQLKDLLRVDEIFITQTTSGILPVVEIDGHKIGAGRPGPVTQNLMRAFGQLVWGR